MNLDIRDFFSILLKRWLIIVICGLIGFGAAYSFSRLMTKPKHVAATLIYVNLPVQSSLVVSREKLETAKMLVNTYIVILQSENFLKQVSADCGLNYTASQIGSKLKMGGVSGTEIFKVEVTMDNNVEASKIVTSIKKLAPQAISSVVESGSVKIVDEPSVKMVAMSSTIRNSIIGFFVGTAISTGIFVLIEVLDYRIKSEEDLETYYNIPILGSVPSIKS